MYLVIVSVSDQISSTKCWSWVWCVYDPDMNDSSTQTYCKLTKWLHCLVDNKNGVKRTLLNKIGSQKANM